MPSDNKAIVKLNITHTKSNCVKNGFKKNQKQIK